MADVKAPDSSLKTRFKSALVFAPVVLAVVWAGGFAFSLMMALAAAVGVEEWGRMVLTGKKDAPSFLPRLAGGLTALGVFSAGLAGSSPLIALCLLLSFCFLVFAVNFSRKGPPAWLVLFGMIYIGFACAIMIWMRGGQSEQGLYYFATLLLVVWASDISAYVAGKNIGGPKLAPKVSPNKTWAGFIGSSVGAGLVAAAIALPVLTQWLDVDTIGGMTYIGYGIMGFLLAMAGQAGDLFISVMKRRFGVKDTGALIPGHGGLLDRIDALLLVALVYGSLVRLAA